MTKLTMILCIVFGAIGCGLECGNVCAQEVPEPTTFYIVRHADRDGSNDALTAAGQKRAQQLSQLMQHLRISEVYSTETSRTQETAEPTADLLELTIQPYGELTTGWFKKLKTDHVGESVLIVGHSNTSGQIVEGLGGQGDFTIEENEFDSLFVVTVAADEASAVRLQFGESNDAGANERVTEERGGREQENAEKEEESNPKETTGSGDGLVVVFPGWLVSCFSF